MQKLGKMLYRTRVVAILLIVCLLFGVVTPNIMAKSKSGDAIKTISLMIGNKKVTKKTYNMKVGEKKRVKVSVLPNKGNKTIKFATSNKRVVTVSKNGTVTAKKAGTAKITVVAKKGKKQKSIWTKIKVVKVPEKGNNKNTPTKKPTMAPTSKPLVTEKPTESPLVTEVPTENPTMVPTTEEPTESPLETETPTEQPTTAPTTEEPTEPPEVTEAPVETSEPDDSDNKKSIVIYFSCTDNTKTIAEYVEETVDADIYRIEAEIPYTSEDLDYSNSNRRTSREQNDATARPALAEDIPSLEEYDYIYLGYPIWWGQAPKIMYTFVENCDLSGKTIIPFCTSASSGIGTSAVNLQRADENHATWLTGRRVSGRSPKGEIEQWIMELNLQ